MNQSTFKTTSEFSSVISSCGEILRGHFSINNQEYRAEGDIDRTWVNVLDEDSRCMALFFEEDGEIVFDGGEYLADSWTSEDWKKFVKFCQ